MYSHRVRAIPLALCLALAQHGVYSATHIVTLSNAAGNLSFIPNGIHAVVGDTVEFQFYGPKHSVAQGALQTPCQPATGGFFSGAISTPGAGSEPNSQIYTLNITSTDAIWIYCAVAAHCMNGMAAVINAP